MNRRSHLIPPRPTLRAEALARRLVITLLALSFEAKTEPVSRADFSDSVKSVQVLARDEPIFSAPDASAPRRGAAALEAHLPLFSSSGGPGCKSKWLLVGPLSWLCSERAQLSETPALQPAESPRYATGLPLSFYIVTELGARAYASLLDKSDGAPVAELEPGFIVGVSQLAKKDGETFGLSNKGRWISLRELRPLKIPTFHGTEIDGDPSKVGWVIRDRSPVFKTPESQGRISTLDRLASLRIFEQRRYRGQIWLRTGVQTWMREIDVRRPSPAPLPPELRPGERWIDVDLERQVLTAYRGEQPVFATLVSTGKGAVTTPLATPKGHFRIWVKLATSDMTNLEEEEARRYYAIQDVPWVMYFKQGYGLHAAFWHNSFGTARSHGCVNLAPLDAERLFHWVTPRLPNGWSAILPMAHDPGTLIVVR
jgi:hypothetical protein